MRCQSLLVASIVLSTQLIACARHQAARVESRVAEIARNEDQKSAPAPGSEGTSVNGIASFEALDDEIHERVARLQDMNFYSMDDNYSLNTWKGFIKGTEPQNRPLITSLLNEIKDRADQMADRAAESKDKAKASRALYLQKNVDRCLRKMAVLAAMDHA